MNKYSGMVGTTVFGKRTHEIRGNQWKYDSQNFGTCGVELSGNMHTMNGRRLEITCKSCNK